MTGFISAAVVLLLVTLALLLRPWWLKSRASAATSRQKLNVAIYRDQFEELARDRDVGIIAAADYETARQEIQRRLLEDGKSGNEVGDDATTTLGSRGTLLLIALALPLLGGGLYAWLGTPAALDPPAPQHQVTADEVDRMVATLAARLEKEPGKLEGWVMLARSYKVLGRFDEAARAYGRAGTYIDTQPDLLADYADVLVAAKRAFTPESRALLQRALKVDPNHGHALWLAGTDAFDAGKFDRAITLWQRVQGQFAPGSEEALSIEGSIAEARAKGGKGGKLVAQTPAPAAAPQPAKSAAAAMNAGSVSGTVDLAAALKQNVGAGDTVMVVARVAGGSRMPVAVLRVGVAELPLKFKLDDSLAMSPDFKISTAASVEVEARISKSGQAIPQKGDLYSAPQTVKVGSGGIKLLLDQVRP